MNSSAGTVVPSETEMWQLLLENDTLHEFLNQLAVKAAHDVEVEKRYDADEAFAHLRHVSQTTNTKIRDVASTLITTTTGKPLAEPPSFY